MLEKKYVVTYLLAFLLVGVVYAVATTDQNKVSAQVNGNGQAVTDATSTATSTNIVGTTSTSTIATTTATTTIPSTGTSTATTSDSTNDATTTPIATTTATSTVATTTPDTTISTTTVATTTATTTSTQIELLRNQIREHQNEIDRLQRQLAALLGTSSTDTTAHFGTLDPVHKTVDRNSVIDFNGRNFGREENVEVTRGGQLVTIAHADGGGNFSTGSLRIPDSTGTYTYMFKGLQSGIISFSTIIVQ